MRLMVIERNERESSAMRLMVIGQSKLMVIERNERESEHTGKELKRLGGESESRGEDKRMERQRERRRRRRGRENRNVRERT